jgi:hypothetical protein
MRMIRGTVIATRTLPCPVAVGPVAVGRGSSGPLCLLRTVFLEPIYFIITMIILIGQWHQRRGKESERFKGYVKEKQEKRKRDK